MRHSVLNVFTFIGWPCPCHHLLNWSVTRTAAISSTAHANIHVHYPCLKIPSSGFSRLPTSVLFGGKMVPFAWRMMNLLDKSFFMRTAPVLAPFLVHHLGTSAEVLTTFPLLIPSNGCHPFVPGCFESTANNGTERRTENEVRECFSLSNDKICVSGQQQIQQPDTVAGDVESSKISKLSTRASEFLIENLLKGSSKTMSINK